MSEFTEYKRPLVVLLIFAGLIFVITNYGGSLLQYENFVDPPFTCGTSTDRRSCIDAGGFWKKDGGAPAGCDPACECCMHNPSFPMSMKYPSMSCSAGASTTFTLTDTQTKFSNTMLPDDTTTLARDNNGHLTADSLKTHMDKLVQMSRLQKAPESVDTQAIYTFLAADEAAIKHLQEEYCYYSARYTYAVQQVIDAASALSGSASASAPSASASSTNSQGADWLAASRMLNGRLRDIISIMKYLTTQRMNTAPSTESAQLNAELAVRMKLLSDQGTDLGANNANIVLYKKMVDYTKQKAKANSNLVLLYTFMNIIALGMLFYVYRAT